MRIDCDDGVENLNDFQPGWDDVEGPVQRLHSERSGSEDSFKTAEEGRPAAVMGVKAQEGMVKPEAGGLRLAHGNRDWSQGEQ